MAGINSSPRLKRYGRRRANISNGVMKTHGQQERLYNVPCLLDAKKVKETETVNEQQTQQEVSPTQRPYSLTGLCIYLGTSSRWWSSFRSECMKKNDEDFLHVIARVEETIETQQFEGACVGAFNANIIARKLGLSDKQEVDHTTQGKPFNGFDFLPYTPEADKLK